MDLVNHKLLQKPEVVRLDQILAELLHLRMFRGNVNDLGLWRAIFGRPSRTFKTEALTPLVEVEVQGREGEEDARYALTTLNSGEHINERLAHRSRSNKQQVAFLREDKLDRLCLFRGLERRRLISQKNSKLFDEGRVRDV